MTVGRRCGKIIPGVIGILPIDFFRLIVVVYHVLRKLFRDNIINEYRFIGNLDTSPSSIFTCQELHWGVSFLSITKFLLVLYPR